MSSFTPAEHYLQDFHQRWAGATSAMFAQLSARTASSRHPSSYALLAASVPATDAPTAVLDLACGDGHLLRLLAERGQAGLRLIGVDMSAGELAAARAVLPDSVTLLQERAQALSIASGSIDVVVSHMALMLMDEIEQVMAEIRRVLRPRGQFATLVGRRFLLGEVADIFHSVFRPIAKEDLSHLPFGDARAHSEAGWRELLSGAFDQVEVEDVEIDWTPTPLQLWDALLQTYSIDRMSAGAREHMRERLLAAVVPLLRDDGTLHSGWGMRLIRARAN